MWEFLLGTAVIVLPRGNLALLAAIGTVKGAGAVVRKIRQRNKEANKRSTAAEAQGESNNRQAGAVAANSATKSQSSASYDQQVPAVNLEWSDVSCTFTSKQGNNKQLLSGVNGKAQAGRCVGATHANSIIAALLTLLHTPYCH